jgi:hypothetical protein
VFKRILPCALLPVVVGLISLWRQDGWPGMLPWMLDSFLTAVHVTLVFGALLIFFLPPRQERRRNEDLHA